MSSKRRLTRLEAARQRRGTTWDGARVHWQNAIDDGTAAIAQRADGTWYDKTTGDTIPAPLRLHWPATPDLAGDDWSDE